MAVQIKFRTTLKGQSLYVYTDLSRKILHVKLPGDLLDITDKLTPKELARLQKRVYTMHSA